MPAPLMSPVPLFFFSSRRRHTISYGDWSSDVCSSDLASWRGFAVVFLHAYANPRHEAEALRLIAEHYPQLYTSASHEVAPEIREFERASTTVAKIGRAACRERRWHPDRADTR